MVHISGLFRLITADKTVLIYMTTIRRRH